MIRTQPGPLTLEIESRAEITGSGLSIPEGLSFDEWLGVGRKLMLADKAVQWAIGDWWAYGDHRYGERASAAIDPATGENRLQRYMDYGFVARKIETSRRLEVLSWSAHREVAALEPDIQDAILSRAVENGWGSREVRAAVKEYKDRLAGGNKPRLSGQTPIEDAEVVEETDAPLMDATDAGRAMAAEKAAPVTRERADFTVNDRGQWVLDLRQILKGFGAPQGFALNLSGVDASVLEEIATWFAVASNEYTSRARRGAASTSARKPVSAGADREGDGKSAPRTASPTNPHREPAPLSPRAPIPDGAYSPPAMAPSGPIYPSAASVDPAAGEKGGADIPVTASPGPIHDIAEGP